jgi:hypothetical protein
MAKVIQNGRLAVAALHERESIHREYILDAWETAAIERDTWSIVGQRERSVLPQKALPVFHQFMVSPRVNTNEFRVSTLPEMPRKPLGPYRKWAGGSCVMEV